MIPWKFSSWLCAWNVPLKIFYFNGDATNEETTVGPKKATGLRKNVVLWIKQPRVCAGMKCLCRLWMPLW